MLVFKSLCEKDLGFFVMNPRGDLDALLGDFM